MRILVLGHWDLSAEDLSAKDDLSAKVLRMLSDQYSGEGSPGNSVRALQELVEGIREGVLASGTQTLVQLRILPVGPASAFVEAIRQDGPASGNFKHIVAGRREASTIAIGSELRELGPFRGTVLVEGGHSWSHDWGIGLLAALVEAPELSLDSPAEALSEALESARELLSGRTIVVAASSSRSLLGTGGTAYMAPDLSLRKAEDDLRFASNATKWRQVLAETYRRTRQAQSAWNLMPVGSEARAELSGFGPLSSPALDLDPTLIEGSGAAGGAAALLAALGVPVRSTWEVLSTLLQLPKLIEEADLVIAVEPHLDSPNLVDSALRQISEIAQAHAVPVLAVGAQSSLSGPERADVGIHGISLIRSGTGEPFKDVGRRVAQTWIR